MAVPLHDTRALWDLCFPEPRSWNEAYFRHLFREEDIKGLWEGDQLVSMLHVIPMLTSFCHTSNTVFSAYLSGFCTHPEYRHRGYSSTLMVKTLTNLYVQNYDFAALIPATPALFDFYSRWDWVRVYDYSTCTFQPLKDFQESEMGAGTEAESYIRPSTLPMRCMTEPWTAHALADATFYARPEGYLFKPAAFWDLIRDDLRLFNGQCLLSEEKKWPRITLCYLTDEALMLPLCMLSDGTFLAHPHTGSEAIGVSDTPANGDSHQSRLQTPYTAEIRSWMKTLCQKKQQSTLTLQCPPIGNLSIDQPLGMSRIVHATRVLSRYAAHHPEISITFQLCDDVIAENNQWYRLDRGNLQVNPTNAQGPAFSIAQTTQAVLGYHTEQLPYPLSQFTTYRPYLSSMLNG